MKLSLHRDGTVTYWSVYQQSWCVHVVRIPDRELAAMSTRDVSRILRHFSKPSPACDETSHYRSQS